MTMPDEIRWTGKLPTLIVGVIVLLASVIALSKRATILAIILFVLGAGFVGYSLTIKDWCEMKGTTLGQSAWGNGFGASFDSCARAKGWLSF